MGLMKYDDTFVLPPDDPLFAEANVTEFTSEYSGKSIYMTNPLSPLNLTSTADILRETATEASVMAGVQGSSLPLNLTSTADILRETATEASVTAGAQGSSSSATEATTTSVTAPAEGSSGRQRSVRKSLRELYASRYFNIMKLDDPFYPILIPNTPYVKFQVWVVKRFFD